LGFGRIATAAKLGLVMLHLRNSRMTMIVEAAGHVQNPPPERPWPRNPSCQARVRLLKERPQEAPDKRRPVGMILSRQIVSQPGAMRLAWVCLVSECAWNLRSPSAVAEAQRSGMNSIDLATNNKEVAV
jgi:hypothetical protein